MLMGRGLQSDGTPTSYLQAGGYYGVQFDNFALKAVRGAGPAPRPPGPSPGPAPAPPPATGCAAPAAGQHLQVYGCSTNATDSHQAWKELPAGGGGVKFQLAADPALCMVRPFGIVIVFLG